MFATIKQRALSGFPLAALVLAGLLYLPSILILALLIITCAMTASEFGRLMKRAALPYFQTTGVLIGVTLTIAIGAATFRAGGDWPWPNVPALSGIVILVVLLRMLFSPRPNAPLAAALTFLGILYAAGLLNFLTLLMLACDRVQPLAPLSSTGFWLIFYLCFVVKMTDNGAYVAGNLWGRHKMIPRISPAKTWEGFAGGLVFGVGFSVLLIGLLRGRLGLIPLPVAQAAGLGLALALAGTAGDLVESQIKRMAGVKDAGRLLPGIGGVLDVLDSILFAAPVLYVYVWLSRGL